jgi:hypothetical protein
MRNARGYRQLRERLKLELQARHEAAPDEYLSDSIASPPPGGEQDQDALARYGSQLPDDVKEAVLFGRVAVLHSVTPAASGTRKTKAHSTKLNSVPPLDDMRAVRRQLWSCDEVGKRFPRFSTEKERDTASIGFALDNIIEARKQRTRNGRPARVDILKEAFEALNASGIPLGVGIKYKS